MTETNGALITRAMTRQEYAMIVLIPVLLERALAKGAAAMEIVQAIFVIVNIPAAPFQMKVLVNSLLIVLMVIAITMELAAPRMTELHAVLALIVVIMTVMAVIVIKVLEANCPQLVVAYKQVIV